MLSRLEDIDDMFRSFSWRHLVYYGEVFGFLIAWAVGLVVALGGQPKEEGTPGSDGLKFVSAAPMAPSLIE